MRSFFLFLSRQKHLRKWMETSSLAKRFAARFVAGETLDQALAVSRKLNSEGISVTLDHLGESVSSLEEAAEARDVYVRTLAAIHDSGIQGNVSLKLTQFGIDISYDQCLANVEMLVRKAAELGSFVRVDMEASDYTDRTLQLVSTLHGLYSSVGIVIQAYLYRSREDVEKLCGEHIRVRLCKGAYLEPADVAFPNKSEVDNSFVELMKLLLTDGAYPAIATHDEAMIAAYQVLGRRAEDPARRIRVPDALRHPARPAAQAGRRRLPPASLRAVRPRLVPLLHAPTGRASGQCFLHSAQYIPQIARIGFEPTCAATYRP